MNTKRQWNTFFSIERNIDYAPHLQDTQKKVLEYKYRAARKPSLSFAGLVCRQFRFLAWKIWLMQGMLLALLCAVFLNLDTYVIISRAGAVLPKLLCCCGGIIAMSAVPILKRSHRCRMAELEQSTRFSMGGNVLSQLLFIGIGDLCMLTTLSAYVTAQGLTSSVIFLSLIIPFLTCATAAMMLWTRVSYQVFERTAVLFSIVSSLCMYALVGWFQDHYGFPAPDGILPVSAVYASLCAVLLFRECRKLHLYGNMHNLI